MDNMTAEKAYKLLRHYNQWRRGVEGYEMPGPVDIGEAIDFACAALSAPRVPEGWALVPVEPTEDMITEALDLGAIDEDDVVRVWNECIAAAPQPPTTTNDDETARLREGRE